MCRIIYCGHPVKFPCYYTCLKGRPLIICICVALVIYYVNNMNMFLVHKHIYFRAKSCVTDTKTNVSQWHRENRNEVQKKSARIRIIICVHDKYEWWAVLVPFSPSLFLPCSFDPMKTYEKSFLLLRLAAVEIKRNADTCCWRQVRE